MAGRFTVIPQNTFEEMQMDAGVLLTSFDPASPAVVDSAIVCATTGGINVSCTAEYSDLGEDVDNCPNNLKELKHLDICCLFDNVVGYEALENLTQLERLWIGKFTYIPEDYIEHLREVLPNTEINTTSETGDGGEWRWVNGNHDRLQPRYELLCRQFDYGNFNRVCAWYWNDPLYYPHD